MDMKKKETRNGSGGLSPAVNLINKGTQIEGQIAADGDIRIDGSLKGTVQSKSKVVIGSSGLVNGKVICRNADVLGKVEGTVEVADTLYLKSTARIEGDIITSKLVIEAGAMFNGNCNMGAKEKSLNEPKIEVATRKEASAQ